MFYVKTLLNNNAAIEVDITPDNVFCRCPVCDCEVPVDLNDFIGDEDFDLTHCSVLCDECGEMLADEVDEEDLS